MTESFESYQFNQSYLELETEYDFESKKLTSFKSKINFVVSHGCCSDGFMSATIVKMYLQQQSVNIDDVTFYHAQYGSDFSKLPELMKDKYVVICDFSFTEQLFNSMIEATNGNILVLDHHKTAQENLHNVPKEYVTFDMNHSGAFLTWTYFFGFNNVPKAVLYVEDNDIWTKKLPLTKEFTSYMFSVDFNFEQYEKFFDDKYLVDTVFPTGSGMVIQNDSLLKIIGKKGIPKFVELNDRYYFIACVGCYVLKSDLGNYLLSVYKNSNLSMVFSHDQFTQSTTISYRSANDRSDCTEIAKTHNGGGHRNASGAKVFYEVSAPPGRVIDPHRAYFMLENVYEIHINGYKEYKFLALNTSTMGKHFVRYLMQERFINNDGLKLNQKRTDESLPGYQEGMYVMRNNLEHPTYDAVYDGAFAYYHTQHKTHIVFKALDGVVSDSVNQTNSEEKVFVVDLSYGHGCTQHTSLTCKKVKGLFYITCTNEVAVDEIIRSLLK